MDRVLGNKEMAQIEKRLDSNPRGNTREKIDNGFFEKCGIIR